MKVLTIHDLKIIKKRAEGTLLLREESNETVATQCCGLALGTEHLQILICGGTGCKASDSHIIAERLQQALEKNNIADKVDIITTGCFGFCEKGPIVKIIPDNTFYTQVVPDDADEIVREHIIGGRKIERLLYIDPKTEKTVSDSKHMDFYRKQMRIALRNCGFIDPENIEEYIALDGYMALADSLLHKKPEEVIDVIKRSGLRGRGGGGFPTGKKWEFAHKQQADMKYVVCNADEGDPGAFMDRSIMEGDPHSIVEAMAVCGYSIGSPKGLVYIRAEYPLAIQRLKIAIAQAREYGLLGKNIFGTDFSFDIEIRYGAGAFVCGEETALIHSMEGKRGEPTLKPPFPAEAGYLGKPTNVNNVETLANIPIILTKGAEWFASIGTERSKGTKVFALAGKINNVGLIEVPMGTTLREVIYEIGGGIKGGKKFKAVQTGGPSGGCLTEKHLDTPIDFDNLLAEGSMMGSGGMIVMGLNQGMQPIAGYNYGAKQYSRVTKVLKITIYVATLITTIGFLMGMLIPDLTVSIFTTDEELVRISAKGLRIVVMFFPIVGFQMVTSNFFQSIGMASKAIFLSVSRQVLILIPCLLILPHFYGQLGVWISMPISDLIASMIAGTMLWYQFRQFSLSSNLKH